MRCVTNKIIRVRINYKFIIFNIKEEGIEFELNKLKTLTINQLWLNDLLELKEKFITTINR